MKPDTAFAQFQTIVNADPEQLATARSRRDAFRTALESEDDIAVAIVGGSLRRGTQRAPISDVDIYAVFDAAEQPDWGSSGSSADAAIEIVAARIQKLLGKDGTHVHLLDADDGTGTHVRIKGRRRHSVKCFIDDPGDGNGFTVDVVPALRHEVSGLLIPERDLRDAEQGKWIRTDPEALVAMVAKKQEEWDLWVPTVRMLKHWAVRADTGMSSLYVEILALDALPTGETRARAIQRFFTAAEWKVSSLLADPAGLCGPVQPDLDVDAAKACIADAASLSGQAVTAEGNEELDDAVCAWRHLFGGEFPQPPCGCDGASARVTAAAAVGGSAPYVKPRRVKQSPQG